jgi:hypothetical protein
MMAIAEPSELRKISDAMKEDMELTAKKRKIGMQLTAEYGVIVLP